MRSGSKPGALALGLFGFACQLAVAGALDGTPPHYKRRGDEVEATYKQFTANLQTLHEKLRAAARKHNPKLLKILSPTPPTPVRYGYQILPKILPDPKPARKKRGVPRDPPPRADSTSYSWSRTEQMLEWEKTRLEDLAARLTVIEKMNPADARAVLGGIVKEYPQIESNQKLIDHHIQYNRFWQKSIAEDRARFERLTVLHDAVVRRQALLDALEAKYDLEVKKEADALHREIQSQYENASRSPFVRIQKGKNGVTELVLKLYSDIQDEAYLRRFRAIVQKKWAFQAKQARYQVRVDLYRLPLSRIWGSAKATPPKGARIDLDSLVARFPKDGAILTTGSNSTFAIPRHRIVLGPQDMTENTVAHEFGHLLGFVDGYFRGFRDRDTQGFEVLEIIPDPEDIMCMPGTGQVREHHFQKLL